MSFYFLRETEEFKRLIFDLKHMEMGLKVSGVIEAAKPYFISLLHQELEKKIVFIRSKDADLSSFERQCRFFLNQFPNPFEISFFPSLSENPYQEIPPSMETVSKRMKFFYELISSPPSLIVTNLFALLKPFPSAENLKKFFLRIEKGRILNRDTLLHILDMYGYLKEDIVNSHGEYAWRGGIVDVFSPWQVYPFRIEFSGSEIVSLREFDTSSQRSVRKVNSIIIPSLREFPAEGKFIQEWSDLAAKKAENSLFEDVKTKIESLQKGDFFPSFVYQSVLHTENFVPFDHYLKNSIFIIDDIEAVQENWNDYIKSLDDQFKNLKDQRKFYICPEEIFPSTYWEKIKSQAIRLQELISGSSQRTYNFPFQSVPRFANKIPFFLKYLIKIQEEGERCFIFLSNENLRRNFSNLLNQHEISCRESSSPLLQTKDGSVSLILGNLDKGFSFPDEKIVYFSKKDIFTEERVIVSRQSIKPFLSDFQDLKAGDYVVHADYGIGIFKGLIRMEIDTNKREFIEILYRDGDKLFVPVEDLNLVQKYSNLGTKTPVLNKLGTLTWEKVKSRIKKEVENMAQGLLNLYAQRKSIKGYSFTHSGAWQSDFEKTFEFEETEDQMRAIKEVMFDMESNAPMDRLICGDVGYGKTEVAIRASFKAVMDGKQVAVLCPTTVLVNQHLKTFQNRMVLFPIRVESLSRVKSRSRQKKIIEDLEKGLVDIIIGTHRVLSEDIHFKDLGILIIDEEQRFGVKDKEKIKQIKADIDVLTMTATPIPRTLNLSISGLRDMSLIETPPQDRLAIHTVVTHFNREIIVSAIKAELSRGGQVYFIHDRVKDIDTVAQMVEKWLPNAKVITIHGRMPARMLEKRMIYFIQQKYNVLVSTTIIENGIDIPLVNTLIVNHSERFGLAQLYQLRGRVGRSSRQAVAYFLVPPYTELTSLARERLKALKEFSELGSGFRLAAKDLEIRGAGNFLGSEQHGYIEAMGFEYYMHLLGNAVKKMKGEKPEEIKSEINLKADIKIPEDYLPQMNLRLNLYKAISSVNSLEEIEKIKKEIKDRYGNLPKGIKNLLRYGVIKYLAQKIKVKTIDHVGRRIIFKFFPDFSADLTKMGNILEKYDGFLTPQGVMSIQFSCESDEELMEETIFVLKELSLM